MAQAVSTAGTLARASRDVLKDETTMGLRLSIDVGCRAHVPRVVLDRRDDDGVVVALSDDAEIVADGRRRGRPARAGEHIADARGAGRGERAGAGEDRAGLRAGDRAV